MVYVINDQFYGVKDIISIKNKIEIHENIYFLFPYVPKRTHISLIYPNIAFLSQGLALLQIYPETAS